MKSSRVTEEKEAKGNPTEDKHMGLTMMGLTNQERAVTEKERFCGPDEIRNYYNILKPVKSKSSNNKYGKEVLLESSFEANNSGNGFMTDFTRLPLWIFAIQESIYLDLGGRDDVLVQWNNKTDKSGNYLKIELKVEKIQDKPKAAKHSFSVEIYLTT